MAEKQKQCPVCKYEDFEEDIFSDGKKRFTHISCKRCGEYYITSTALVDQGAKRKISDNMSAIAGLIRELTEKGEEPIKIFSYSIGELIEHYIIPDMNSVEAKAEKLLQRIKEKTLHFGADVLIAGGRDFPLAYAENEIELYAILDLLEQKGLIVQDISSSGSRVKISADGMTLGNELSSTANKESKQAFVAIWFHASMRGTADAIKAAMKTSGFTPICIWDEHFSEKIMDKALGEIRGSRFLVVDLTGNRPSVFFEAGFANGLDIETIYVYNKNKKLVPSLEFYVRHYQCYPYKTVDELKEKLINAIKARIN